MKIGIRKPSLKKRIAARTSPARFVRHSMGLKAPRGYGWFTNPKKAAYNRVYNRTTVKADGLIILAVLGVFYLLWALISFVFSLFNNSNEAITSNNSHSCPRCNAEMILRNGKNGQFYGCSRFPRCRGTRDYIPEAENDSSLDMNT